MKKTNTNMKYFLIILILFMGCTTDSIPEETVQDSIFKITISYGDRIQSPLNAYLPSIVHEAQVLEVIQSDGRLINLNGTLRAVRVNDRVLFDFTDYTPTPGKGSITEYKGLFHVRAEYDSMKRRMIVTEANRWKTLIKQSNQ